MNAFRNWYLRNYNEITWFIIGWLALATLTDFGNGRYINTMIDLFLLGVNYFFVRQR